MRRLVREAGTRVKLAVLTTHAIQYHAGWFRALAAHPEIDLEVLYCHRASPKEQAEAGFGVEFDWDVSLLDDYSYRFLTNVAREPGISRFNGLDTPEIKDILALERFDAVMINGWHYRSAWQTMRACWKLKTPVMMRSDSHLHSQRSLVKQLGKRPFYYWFISKLDACLPVGEWSKDYFLHYGAKPDRLFIVPHVVDTDYFASESARLMRQRATLQAQWGLDDSRTVFLFAGKFTEIKRPLDFVNAIAEATLKGARVAGLMVGDGPLRSACEETVRDNDLPIRFAGFLNQSRMAEAYVSTDALVLPSTAETWGVVVNEAMACGRPCFVSDGVGSGPDMVRRNETGASFSVGDTKALGLMLSEFAANKKQMRWMSVRAEEQAQKYTLRVAVECTVRALEAVTK